MREILFKAINKENDKWVEGSFVQYQGDKHWTDNCEIWVHNDTTKDGRYHTVKRETVCQFTGLTDSEGVKIYEGDILNNDYIVVYDAPAFKQRLIDFANSLQYQTAPIYSYQKITGNIHNKQK